MFRKNIKWQTFLPNIAGNAVEYYNIFLFAFLARTFTAKFLPFSDETLGISIYFFFVYFLPSIAGIFGAYFLGKAGDKLGRRYILSITILGMGVCSLVVGFLPDYHMQGIFAPILLFFFRALQVFFAAGEYNGGIICCIENSPKKAHGSVSGVYCAATASGIMLASSVSAAIYYLNEDLWRVAFVLSGILTLIVGYYRRKSPESAAFIKASNENFEVGNRYRKVFAIAISSCFFGVSYGFAIKILPVIFSMDTGGKFPLFLISIKNSLVLVVYAAFLLFAGAVCNKVSEKKVMRYASVMSLFICVVASMSLDTKSMYLSMLLEVSLLINAAFFIVAFHIWAVSLFGIKSRYKNISVGYTFGRVVSSIMPASLIILWGKTHNTILLVSPLFVLSLISIYTINYIKEE